MNIGLASGAEVDRLWPYIVNDVQSACEHSPFPVSAGNLWQMCRSGNGFLCIAHEGDMLLASVIFWFERDTLRIWALTGKGMTSWLADLSEYITNLARENGALRIVCTGRRGWLRVFKNARVNGADYEVIL